MRSRWSRSSAPRARSAAPAADASRARGCPAAPAPRARRGGARRARARASAARGLRAPRARAARPRAPPRAARSTARSPAPRPRVAIVEPMSAALRSFHHCEYPPSRIAAARSELRLTVSVCLPARECAGTVGAIVEALHPLKALGAIDELVVVDAASADGTAEVAARAGAEVWLEDELAGELGPALGKGDAMWRALSHLRGDLVCF